ncbi:serum amyloid A protein [Dermacentor silvarum]|uniref:serum amyloid A protein n=1 Tax=Dermacentor silvarum TaxID=543639 RepID=UPI001896E98A|nr:serum amyloid A protein [Dermacentor silvarum]
MRGSSSSFVVLLLASSLALAAAADRLRRSSIFGMAACVTRNAAVLLPADGRCAAGKLQAAYSALRDANCINCDKYFHCIGNYRAVYECNNSEDARRAAQAISDCREEADNGGADSAADQEANRYGRGGGDCAQRYLAAVRCAYNPETRRCG